MAENAFTRKLGPLPVWAWGILGGIAVYFLYTRYKNSSGTVQSPVATALDPNAVDPATGLTYGQELAGSYPSAGGLQGSAGGGTSGGGTPSLTDNLNGFDTELQAFAGALADLNALNGQVGATPPNPSDATVNAAASPALQNTSPPAAGARPSVGAPAGPHGAIVAPYGPHKPPAKAGYTTVGTGRGGWIYVPHPQTHKQTTVHVANPAPHQQPATKPRSAAKPVPVKHPASGGGSYQTPSGSHQPAAPPPRAVAPVRAPAPPVRAPAHPPPKPPPHKPPPHKGVRR